MIAYHGDKKVKSKYVRRVRAHAKADQLVQGYGYWEDGKGCAVGCTIHGSEHSAYETELGIPRAIARIEDRLFECLPTKRARRWPSQFLAAIPVGADLSMVVPRFLVFILTDCRPHAEGKVLESVDAVIAAYNRMIGGETISREEWQRIRAAAYAAAAYAADAAAAAAARTKARESAYIRFADELLRLLADAPIFAAKGGEDGE